MHFSFVGDACLVQKSRKFDVLSKMGMMMNLLNSWIVIKTDESKSHSYRRQ